MRMMFSPALANILVVDEEWAFANSLVTTLQGAGYRAVAAYDGDGAAHTARHFKPHLLLSNVSVPGMNGLELAKTILEFQPECKILLYCSRPQASLMNRIRQRGFGFLQMQKPIDPNELVHTVSKLLPREKQLEAA
jgi:two-component system, response regulator YesN